MDFDQMVRNLAVTAIGCGVGLKRLLVLVAMHAVEEALTNAKGNQTVAAKAVGINRGTFRKYLKGENGIEGRGEENG